MLTPREDSQPHARAVRDQRHRGHAHRVRLRNLRSVECDGRESTSSYLTPIAAGTNGTAESTSAVRSLSGHHSARTLYRTGDLPY